MKRNLTCLHSSTEIVIAADKIILSNRWPELGSFNMVVIELFVYAFIASMMLVCVNYLSNNGDVKRLDFIYFYVLFTLIVSQIFIQFFPQIRNSAHYITSLNLGVMFTLILIYFVAHTTVSVPNIREDTRVWISLTMYFVFVTSLCVLLMGLPDTKTDLFRMPFALALCIGMKYYPPIFEQLGGLQAVSENRMEEDKEPLIELATENREEVQETTMETDKAPAIENPEDTVLNFPANISVEGHKAAVVNLAIESWRFARVFERMLTKLDAGEHKRYMSQHRWFLKKVEESLEEINLRVVNVEGLPYDPGMAATPLNIEEFDTDDTLVVDRMVEPIIMESDKLIKTGTVTLRRIDI